MAAALYILSILLYWSKKTLVKQVKKQVKRGTKIVVSKVVRGRGRPTKVVKKVSAPKVTRVVRKRPTKVVQPEVMVQREEFEVIGDCGSSAPDVVINLGNYQLREKTIQRRNLQAYRNFEAVADLII